MHPVPLLGAVALALRGRPAPAPRPRWLGSAVVAPGSACRARDRRAAERDQADRGRGTTLGKWTYLLVGVLAFLETGAFIGLVAPGETAVLVGGVVAGQGRSRSRADRDRVGVRRGRRPDLYTLGRRLGRQFLVRHGPRLKITEDRLDQVEGFFDRHGGMTILIGRFIGLVRAIAPFVAGASKMPLREFLPYDVLGAGLWSAPFCLLGYFFWRSLRPARSKRTSARALAASHSRARRRRLWLDLAARSRTCARGRAALERRRAPAQRRCPVGAAAWPAARPRPAHASSARITPGELGLELTTLLALAAVGDVPVLRHRRADRHRT